MMYANKSAIAVKVNGKVLREFKETVYIPFGSEYSILIKNLNTKRGIFHVFLDGDDVTPGGLILNAGQELDLERWIKNGNLSEGNRFKFIERTAEIEEHRGIEIEDGLIKVEYQFEIDYPKPLPNPYFYPYINHQPYWYNEPLRSWCVGGTAADAAGQVSKGITTSAMNAATSAMRSSDNAASYASSAAPLQTSNAAIQNTVAAAQATYTNDVGITVPGSKSEQKFRTVSGFPVDSTKFSMILKLLGETPDNKPVIAPVTVKAKTKCVTCGTQNKATAHFCHKCGTALEIFA